MDLDLSGDSVPLPLGMEDEVPVRWSWKSPGVRGRALSGEGCTVVVWMGESMLVDGCVNRTIICGKLY